MSVISDDLHVGLVVEGKGEKEAVPLLLRKHSYANDQYVDYLGKPIVVNGRGQLTRPGGIEGYVATAAYRPGCVAVLVIADADDDAACKLGPELQARGQSVTERPVVVALAERCFEDWIYASVETLELGEFEYDAKKNGSPIVDWLLSINGSKYVKPVWQPKLTSRMDLALAISRSESLNRLLGKAVQLSSLVEDGCG